MRTIKTAKFGQSNGVYASLSLSSKGIDAIENGNPVMLPCFSDDSLQESTSAKRLRSALNAPEDRSEIDDTQVRKRKEKGCHLLPLVKKRLESKENWKEIQDKKVYELLGTFSAPSHNNYVVVYARCHYPGTLHPM